MTSIAVEMHGRGVQMPRPTPTTILHEDSVLKGHIAFIMDKHTLLRGSEVAALDLVQPGGRLYEGVGIAEGKKAHFLEQMRGRAWDDETRTQLQQINQECDEARDNLQRGNVTASAASAKASPWTRRKGEVEKLLPVLARQGYERVEEDISENDTITSTAAEALRVRRDGRDVKSLPPPFEEALEALEDQMARIAVKPTLHLGDRGINITFPSNATGIADNASGLLAWAAAEKLREELVAQLQEYYAGGIQGVSRREKAKRIARLRSEADRLDRIEAALTWRALGAGEDVTFRPSISIEAVLGIRVNQAA